MKKILFYIPVLALYLFPGCNDNGMGFIPVNNNIYPAKLNMEWEYNTVLIVEYYDSTGNISNTDTTFSENTLVRVVSTNEVLGTYRNLIKFESYDVSTPENKGYNWYSNTDSGLVSIAYTNPGSSQLVIPKINGKKHLTLEEFKSLINSPEQNYFSSPSKIISDSVQYYEIPRRVLAYPLTVNKRWVELILPWYRERYVDKMVNVNFNGQPINCYEIKIDWPTFNNIELNDYVSLNEGLVRREIISDSIMITSEVSPDSGGFGNVYTVSNLVRINR